MSSKPSERKSVAVIGAGAGGLAAARALLKTGRVAVTVYERAERPGGVIRTSLADGFLREHAANGFLPVRSGDGAIDLAGELGVAIAEAAPAAKKRWIYRHGELHALPGNPRELVETRLLSWRGKLAALGEPFRRGRPAGEETVFEFACRRLGREVAEALVAPFVTGVFAGRADELSLEAAFPTLAELDEDGGLIVGQLRRLGRKLGRRDRGKGGRKARQKLRLAAPVGGVEKLVQAMQRDLGDALVTSAPVVAIEPGPGSGARLVFADGNQRDFDSVVLATPGHVSAELVAGAAPQLSAVLSEIPYVPVAIVYLGARRSDIAHPLDGFGFLVAENEDVRLLGTVFESVLWSERAPSGHVLLRSIFGGSRDPEVLELSDDELLATAQRDLDRVLGGFAGIDFVHRHVVRQPRAIAQYTLGHKERVARAETLAQPMGITLAGSAYHGVAVNKLVADAARVVRRVADHLGVFLSLVLLVLLLGTLGCAGGNRENIGSEGGAEAARVSKQDAPAESSSTAGRTTTDRSDSVRRKIEVAVAWKEASARLRRPAGRNPCGQWRRAPVSVHTLGGVRSAVVTLESPDGGALTEQTGDDSAGLSVVGCRLEPRVAVVRVPGTVVVRNDDERRHRVTFERVSPAGDNSTAAELPISGSQVGLAVKEPGVWRLRTGADPEQSSYVVASAGTFFSLTDDKGHVRFDDVPAGAYEAVAWHPPIEAGRDPIERRQPVEVAAAGVAAITISLGEKTTEPGTTGQSGK